MIQEVLLDGVEVQVSNEEVVVDAAASHDVTTHELASPELCNDHENLPDIINKATEATEDQQYAPAAHEVAAEDVELWYDSGQSEEESEIDMDGEDIVDYLEGIPLSESGLGSLPSLGADSRSTLERARQ
ncbi:hypothetical protein FRB91_010221 [Serendipita sp. 411]|nr:hypothetical protein FRC18_004457 [Serendipita sp. 400]KAG8849119.1 hypothetical protein FRB91_010221 [Serendipita sp. 411]